MPCVARVPEGMEHILQGCGWLVVITLGLLLEAADDCGHLHGCDRSLGSCWLREALSMAVLWPDDGGGVAIAHVHAGRGGLRLIGKLGWWAFQASG